MNIYDVIHDWEEIDTHAYFRINKQMGYCYSGSRIKGTVFIEDYIWLYKYNCYTNFILRTSSKIMLRTISYQILEE